MFLLKLLESPTWHHLQLYWEALEALSDYFLIGEAHEPMEEEEQLPARAFDWDQLRLLLDRRLMAGQELVLQEAMTLQELKVTQEIVLFRLEQGLLRLNQQRQLQHQQYAVAPDPYLRPKYSRYHALKEIEQQIKGYKTQEEYKEYLPIHVHQHIVEDMSMELIEIFAKRLSEDEREKKWHVLLQSVLALSCNEIPHQSAVDQVMDLLEQEDPFKLALRVAQSSSYEKSIESAIRILARYPGEDASKAYKRIIQRFGESYYIQEQAIEQLGLIPDSNAFELLLEIIKSDIDDEERDVNGRFYHHVRVLALRALQGFKKEKSEQTQMIETFQVAINQSSWGIFSQLTAIQVLASLGVYVGFEIAVMALQMSTSKDYSKIQELAADTLVILKDRRAIQFLFSALNELTKSETVIERYKGAFKRDTQFIIDKLCWGLQQFGIIAVQDLISGEWFQDEE